MPALYKLISFKFDMAKFAATLRAMDKETAAVLEMLVGVDRSTLRNWSAYAKEYEGKHPSMMNFLRVCNHLDLDPREYFVLDEPPVNTGDTPTVPAWSGDFDSPLPKEWAYGCGICGKPASHLDSNGRCSTCRTIWAG